MPKGSEARGLLMGLHGLFGTSIFVLVWMRLLGRLTPRPPITPAAAWQTGISHLMHLALYVLMIATPILAWLMLAAADKPFPYFGFHVPALVPSTRTGQTTQVLARTAGQRRLLADRPARGGGAVSPLLGAG
jgi:cytochrome b561